MFVCEAWLGSSWDGIWRHDFTLERKEERCKVLLYSKPLTLLIYLQIDIYFFCIPLWRWITTPLVIRWWMMEGHSSPSPWRQAGRWPAEMIKNYWSDFVNRCSGWRRQNGKFSPIKTYCITISSWQKQQGGRRQQRFVCPSITRGSAHWRSRATTAVRAANPPVVCDYSDSDGIRTGNR